MSDLLCLECGHEVEYHSQDPDGVGSCIQGWSKRSAKNQCICELTPDRAAVLALSNKIEAITHQRDEAREGWEYARLTSQQWQTAYNDLLTKSQVQIESATGANFDVRTLEPREATPIFCDHSRWQEAESQKLQRSRLHTIRQRVLEIPVDHGHLIDWGLGAELDEVVEMIDNLLLFPPQITSSAPNDSIFIDVEPVEATQVSYTNHETPLNANFKYNEQAWLDAHIHELDDLGHISESEKRQKEPEMGVSVDAPNHLKETRWVIRFTTGPEGLKASDFATIHRAFEQINAAEATISTETKDNS